MASKMLPVLGEEGWVSGQKKLDYLLAHLYASDYSQTHFFRGEVSSMAKIVQQYQGRLGEARRAVEEMLITYFNRYFDKVEVSVSIAPTEDFHQGELILSASLIDETGEKFELHEVMTNKGSLVRTFLNQQYEDIPS